MPFIVIVAGSRGFTDYDFVAGKLDVLLANKTDIIIRQGDCKNSPDLLGKRYAEERGYSLQSFPADWSQGRGAGWKRNWDMARGNTIFPDKADALVAFDAGTQGTGNMIEIADKCGIPKRVYKVVVEKPTKKTKIINTTKATAISPKTPISQPSGKSGKLPARSSSPVPAPGGFNELDAAIPAGRPRKRGVIVIEGEELVAKSKDKSKKRPVPAGDSAWKARYKEAHDKWFEQTYPSAFRDGHLLEPTYPRVRESNGMQTAIVSYLNWIGHRAKRINNMGRLVDGVDVTESGAKLTKKKWLPSAAGKGQADVSATIDSISCQIEVKAGGDKPSAHQLKEQAKERKAGGVYEFIYSIEQFFQWYDSFMASRVRQNNLFE